MELRDVMPPIQWLIIVAGLCNRPYRKPKNSIWSVIFSNNAPERPQGICPEVSL